MQTASSAKTFRISTSVSVVSATFVDVLVLLSKVATFSGRASRLCHLQSSDLVKMSQKPTL